ncbi:hypothetical protein F2Q69_00007708 [Brassica cretica]|uniref:Uncharacterized protein n=1 Tax=Brassica cretica TaxID=69181 RepID=A0A8S9NST3_BRACR|nr:hypothetical protein F2Q69_00007708 [Brassica cretica]
MSEIHRWFSLGLFVDSVTLLVNYAALWLSSSILSGSARWPSSTNHGGYPRRLLLITIKRMNGGLISSPRKSVDIAPPNSPISLLEKGSRRNRNKLLERFILSSQERTSMLNQGAQEGTEGIKKEPKLLCLHYVPWR